MALNIRMQPAPPSAREELSPKICIFGVGGGGVNSVNNMVTENIEGVELFACNSDSQSLTKSLCPNKIQLGPDITGGLGAGARPEVGRAAAEESIDEVMSHIHDANMVFITAGMGGGTGTGAAPVIAKACREQGILTVGVVTKPFHFEGTHRMKMAEAGIEEMQQYVDTLIIIPNQNLFRVANEKTTFADAFKMADSVLQSGVKGVTDLMVMPGLINLDFADIRSAMLDQGKAMLGTGEASGERRAIEAAEAAINNPLLDDVSMKGAKGVIINITGGYDMTLFEADEACNRIRDEVDPEANIIFGSTFDETLDGTMRVSVIATGIDQTHKARKPIGSGFDFNKVPANRIQTGKPATSSAPVTQETGEKEIAPVAQYAKEQAQAKDEPETELFEQTAYESKPQKNEPAIMRGERFNNAFIPPAPVEVDKSERDLDMTTSYQQVAPPVLKAPAPVVSAAPSAPVQTEQQTAPQQTQTQTGYTLRPAVTAQQQEQEAQKRTAPPSFLERITGLAHNTRNSVSRMNRQEPAPSQPAPSAAPTQGSLAIDTPSTKPQPKDDNNLDIPAFLRRQAN